MTQMWCAVCFHDALQAFLKAGYPVPVQALSRRFGVAPSTVSKWARRLKQHDQASAKPFSASEPVDLEAVAEAAEPIAVLAEPVCPACSEPLEPEPDGLAACIGCGRVWSVKPQRGVSSDAEAGGTSDDASHKCFRTAGRLDGGRRESQHTDHHQGHP